MSKSVMVLGVGLIALCALLLANPTGAGAQIIHNPNEDVQAIGETINFQTDHPDGLAGQVPPDYGAALNNAGVLPDGAVDAPEITGVMPPEVSLNNLEVNQAAAGDNPQVDPSLEGLSANAPTAGNVLVIPVADFRSDGSQPSSSFFSFADGNIRGTPAEYGCVTAPAYLPQGGLVYQFWASVIDNDADYNIYISLRRVNNYSGVSTVMAEVGSSGADTAIDSLNDYSIVEPNVVYPDYSYYITTCLTTANMIIDSVRIWY